MVIKRFITASALILLISCTQNLATIEIHRYNKNTHPNKPINNIALDAKDEYIFVEYGETIYSIAIKHNKSYLDIAAFNNLEWPYSLEVGQKLYITKPAESTNFKKIEKDTEAPVTEMREVISETSTPEENSPTEKKINVDAVTTNFKWPINGKILSNFGTSANGTKNDGIYIEATLNEPIKATSSGKVIYSGQDLEQYGNLLIISHKDQWFSAYAHLSELSVAKGAEIEAGQIIGLSGDTGNISSPQLYFSLRKNKTPVDPLKFLPKKYATD